MIAFIELFKANLKISFRDKQGFYWMVLLPVLLYVAVSLLPVGQFLTPGQNYSHFLLPGIIAMTIMQTGIYNLAYFMIDLKAQKVVKRFMATPIDNRMLLIAIIAARLVVIFMQVALLSVIGILIFQTPFAGNFFSFIAIILLSFLGGAIFLMIGLLISNYANSYQAAAPITSTLGIPLAVLGTVFFPITALPPSIQTISKFLPLTYLTDGLRQSYLYTFDFSKIGFDLLIVTVWAVIMLILTMSLFRLKE